MSAKSPTSAVDSLRDNAGRTVSEQTTIYLIAGTAAVLSVGAWLYWIVVPTWCSYARWWERLVAVLLSVYVLAALVLAGAGLGAVMLLYADRI